jgi:hypothetical protein
MKAEPFRADAPLLQLRIDLAFRQQGIGGKSFSAAILCLAIGCGAASPEPRNLVHLSSDAGEYIGRGRSYDYTNAVARLTMTATGGHLKLFVEGDETWLGEFQVPAHLTRIESGAYENARGFPSQLATEPGLSWSGEGRGCVTLTGFFVVDRIAYSGATLLAIDLRFEQHCEGGPAALRGEIHWNANDTTAPPGPVSPPPPGLWEPEPGSTPATGSYVYLQSDPADSIGQGNKFTYTKVDATLFVGGGLDNRISVDVTGDETWFGLFAGMSFLTAMQPGYYGSLRRYFFHNPLIGGLDWFGEGRSCVTLSGWFVIDEITLSGVTLATLDLRFEQHCEGGAPALHGKIHWDANDPATIPGPVPPPSGLWEPAPGSTPATGNYVRLESEPGDFVGGGQAFTYTAADAILSLSSFGTRVTVGVTGNENWRGDFATMASLSQFEVGYYGDLRHHPFQGPARGGLDWVGQNRSCATVTGWFVVDAVVYAGDSLDAIDLRFEQHCEGATAALHGKIHLAP